ncbi:DUF4229 domain-containing protein [Phycicoccus avicenniae]|uniref:DUF4229 domain-containing protein n=1 Tax=Phycicoccus avicenniae TaxID=2828860 RepID=UPI003D299185
MNAMVRYTVLRLMIFLGCLLALWLVGLRGPENSVLLVVLAAVLSLGISFFALRRFREDYSAALAQRLEERAALRTARGSTDGSDEQAEDAETGAGAGAARVTRPEDDDFR